MIGANLRFGSGSTANSTLNGSRAFQCHPGGTTEATVIFSLGALGIAANIALMGLILTKRQLRRYRVPRTVIFYFLCLPALGQQMSALTLFTCIWGVPGSNLGRGADNLG
jgi:hypothetical protein